MLRRIQSPPSPSPPPSPSLPLHAVGLQCVRQWQAAIRDKKKHTTHAFTLVCLKSATELFFVIASFTGLLQFYQFLRIHHLSCSSHVLAVFMYVLDWCLISCVSCLFLIAGMSTYFSFHCMDSHVSVSFTINVLSCILTSMVQYLSLSSYITRSTSISIVRSP